MTDRDIRDALSSVGNDSGPPLRMAPAAIIERGGRIRRRRKRLAVLGSSVTTAAGIAAVFLLSSPGAVQPETVPPAGPGLSVERSEPATTRNSTSPESAPTATDPPAETVPPSGAPDAGEATERSESAIPEPPPGPAEAPTQSPVEGRPEVDRPGIPPALSSTTSPPPPAAAP